MAIPIDSIDKELAIHSVFFLSTNDPEYLDGIHSLSFVPDRIWETGTMSESYYKNGDTLYLTPAPTNNYTLRPGYTYTFGIKMMKRLGLYIDDGESGCPIGTVPFTVSVVPDHLRWAPGSSESNQWNNPDNWLGIDQHNQPIHQDAHFAPLPTSNVIIPTLEAGLPYPEMVNPASLSSRDSVKQTGFTYNTCDSIRFMSGSAIGQQERLAYTGAVVDMSTPHGKWALRGAPVTGMLSGDLFMADADLTNHTPMWEVGEFDANGRSYKTGNASFWLSLYSRSIMQKGNGDNIKDTTYTADAQWSKVTNGMTYSLPAGQGWAVFTRTTSGDAAVRLPKSDDIFYYYYANGDKSYDNYEQKLQALRDAKAGGAGKAGKLAYQPSGSSQSFTLTNEVDATSFVFANPTMGYIDIWGFIEDNSSLSKQFDYINAEGTYTTINQSAAELTDNTITNLQRYLPPMQAIVLTTAAARNLTVTLNTNRVVTNPVTRGGGSGAPARAAVRKGIMTVTATNPASSRCTSKLLLGQGYHAAIRDGEDALLTTVNIDNYTNNTTPATPFNIYAVEGQYGLSIDLRDEIVDVPLSFSISALNYAPMTYLWFTGVNSIDGNLVLYDSLTMTERDIKDGICLVIETPSVSHDVRYYIRRHGPITPTEPDTPTEPITTDYGRYEADTPPAVKIIRDGHVYILRNGHMYSIIGQEVR